MLHFLAGIMGSLLGLINDFFGRILRLGCTFLIVSLIFSLVEGVNLPLLIANKSRQAPGQSVQVPAGKLLLVFGLFTKIGGGPIFPD
jgi:hypothetical protein